MRISLIAVLLFLLAMPAYSQGEPAGNAEQHEDQYEWRIRQERLYGVYIPRDLAEVFNQLTQLSEASGRENFKRLSERGAATRPFFGLGRWMSHNWGFYGGSRLTVYLNQLNLHHPDDMTRFLLVMYHRHLNDKPLDPKPVVDGLLQTRRENEQQKLLENGTIIHEETRTRDSIPRG